MENFHPQEIQSTEPIVPAPKDNKKMFLLVRVIALLIVLGIGYYVFAKPKSKDLNSNFPAVNNVNNGRSLDQLKEAYRVAHNSKNIEGVINLYYLVGVDEKTKDSLIRNNSDDFVYDIDSIEIVEPNSFWKYEYDFEGAHYKVNLPVSNAMRVNFKDSATVKAHNTEFLVGVDQGSHYLITAAKTP